MAGADFNQYIRVDKVEGKFNPINQKHEVGHVFLATFHVTNTTSENLRFTSTPPLEWKEIIDKQDSKKGETKEQVDKYAQKPDSQTFYGWRTMWQEAIEPNQTKQIIVQDVPRITNIDEGDRTVSRSIKFDIGVPGNGPRLTATQNVKVSNGVKQELDFQIH